MKESKNNNQKGLPMIWRLALIMMLLVNLIEDRYKQSDYYKEKIMQDIMVGIKEERFGNIKITSLLDKADYEIYEYTDLQWWDKYKEDSIDYKSEMQYESDLIKRRQNNELLKPYARLFENINELEILKLRDPLIGWHVKMEIELEKIESDRKEQIEGLIVECYLDEEIIAFRLDEKIDKDNIITNVHRMNEKVKNIVEDIIEKIVDSK